MKKFAAFSVFFALTVTALWTYAFAYLDPSSMTYMIQIIAGVVVAVGAGLGFYWKRIRKFVKNRKQKEQGVPKPLSAPAEAVSIDGGEEAVEVKLPGGIGGDEAAKG